MGCLGTTRTRNRGVTASPGPPPGAPHDPGVFKADERHVCGNNDGGDRLAADTRRPRRAPRTQPRQPRLRSMARASAWPV